jgi:hypothetical protein
MSSIGTNGSLSPVSTKVFVLLHEWVRLVYGLCRINKSGLVLATQRLWGVMSLLTTIQL